MIRRKEKQKLQNKKINYQKKLIDLFKKKYPYFILGVGVLGISLYLLFNTTLLRLKNIRKRNLSQKIEKQTSHKKEKFYQVKEGDTLWQIAEKFYGSGFNMKEIIKANNITNPDMIEKGQILIIPSVKSKSSTQENIEKVKKTENYHVVQPGDDLWHIALKNYGDGYAWLKIAQANKISNPDIILPGTKLIIP